MWRRIWAMMQKEFIQTLRDRRALAIQIGLPIAQLILFAYAIRMNVEHIPTAIADQSLDAASRAFIDAMTASGYFDAIAYVDDQRAVLDLIDEGSAQAGIIIPPQFSVRVARNEAQVLLLVDGSDIFTSQTAYNTITAIARAHATGIAWTRVERTGALGPGATLLPLDARVRILYNPNLEDLIFLIPGMVATILQTQTIILTAAAVVREREAGTIEQLLVTPIRTMATNIPTAATSSVTHSRFCCIVVTTEEVGDGEGTESHADVTTFSALSTAWAKDSTSLSTALPATAPAAEPTTSPTQPAGSCKLQGIREPPIGCSPQGSPGVHRAPVRRADPC